MREIECMRGGVDRVDLDRRHHIEAGLLETQAQSSRTGEKVDSNWAHRVLARL